MPWFNLILVLSVVFVGAAGRADTKAAPPATAGAAATSDATQDLRLRVFSEATGPWMETIEDKEFDMVTMQNVTKDNHDALIRREGEGDAAQLVLQLKDGSVLTKISEDAEAARNLRTSLVNLWRWRFLSQLGNDDPKTTVKVDVRLVPLDVRVDENGVAQEVIGVRKNPQMKNGLMVLREGDYALVELRNRSATNVYVTILDLSPNTSVAQIFPNPRGLQYNIIPADGAWHPTFVVPSMTEPFGREVFKVIATKQYVDFRPFQASIPPPSRGAPTTGLGKLLLSAKTGKRQVGLAGVADTDWATAEVAFEIIPKR